MNGNLGTYIGPGKRKYNQYCVSFSSCNSIKSWHYMLARFDINATYQYALASFSGQLYLARDAGWLVKNSYLTAAATNYKAGFDLQQVVLTQILGQYKTTCK